MTGSNALDRLSALAGIEDGWWDFFGTWRPVPAETKRAFLTAMGFRADTEEAVRASLEELEARPWRRWLEPVLVVDRNGPEPAVTLTVPAQRDAQVMEWMLEEELGAVHAGSFRVDTLEWQEERWLDGVLVKRWRLRLPEVPPLGYHRFRLGAPDGASAAMTLIVAPEQAYVPPALEDGGKVWGVATQLYALRSRNDWGVGTYTALERFAAGVGALGAATVGVNPLHALFPAQPERFSPYAPSSRRFLNVAYIDVETIPEFAADPAARQAVAAPGFQAALVEVNALPLVDYPAVARLTRPVLEQLYRTFRARHLEPVDRRGAAFRRFQETGNAAARLFCTFEALHERFLAEGKGYWRHWPQEFRHPGTPEVRRFAEENRDRIEFFWWLQFVADEQLAAAHAEGKAAGAVIGLYRDLGVGIAGDGAEAWLEQDNLSLGVSVGAPPDPLALKGQDWGLVPFNPIALREAAYGPFIGVMAANMRHAGALRLDHAMALQRLYWVPAGAAADQGAYVRYPVDDLFRLVALESRRNHCLIIGEDLGTVPDGFRERMDRMAMFAYRVMVFEKDHDQRVRRPEDFDGQALAIFATHDLPSVRGWWDGIDIDRREDLDLYPRPEMAAEERDARQRDREAMVAALGGEGLLAPDFPAHGPLDDSRAVALAAAAHEYLARARSRLMMVQVEDVLGLESQMNLPGTTDQHPNWRSRFPADVEAILADGRLKRLAAGLNGRRTARA
ncbi:MAG: 4-alpha-glucanotransferase [Magnetospirillum sp.]|nr:4-alpha-glucanotransferase [Magnetospirillum sp.]